MEKVRKVKKKNREIADKLNRNNVTEMWNMRNMSVRDFIEGIKKHPDLKFFISVVGFWWLMRTAFVITIVANVIYYLLRIFDLVLG